MTYSSAVLNDRPLIYYRFGETTCCLAVDSSGHGTNGSYAASGIAYNSPGLLTGDTDPAVATTAAGGAVGAGDSTLPSGSASRTIEEWFKTNSTAKFSLFSYGQSGNNNQYFMLSWRTGGLNGSLTFVRWGDDIGFSLPYPINDGAAHAIAVTYDASLTVTAYLDGQQIGQRSLSPALATPLGPGLTVGGGSDGPFGGTLDEFAIYSGALNAAQLNAHWRAGQAVGCPATPLSGYSGAVAADSPLRQFRLGEASGRAALDFSTDCRAGAYQPGATHVAGLLSGDSNGAAGSPSPADTMISVSGDGLPFGLNPRTIEFWEQTTATTDEAFFSYGTRASNQYFQLGLHGGALYFVGWEDDRAFNLPYPINDGHPHAIALAYNGALRLTAFVDGQQVGQVGLGAGLNTTRWGQALTIGNGDAGAFTGTIDEFAIFGLELRPDQINGHWQAGVAATGCPATPASRYAQAVVASNPIRYYRFGNPVGQAAPDYSGTCRDAAYAYGASRVSGLLRGDPNDGAVGNPPAGTAVSGSSDGLPDGFNPRTVEFWVQTTAATEALFSYGTRASNDQYFELSLLNGTVYFVGWANDTPFTLPYPINDGNPHAIAVTYDGATTVTLFVDGQQVNQRGLNARLDTMPSGQALLIGNGDQGAFRGTLGDFAIYPTALAPADINSHWQAGAGAGLCQSIPTTGYAGAIAADDPVRYWRLGDSFVAADSSGNCRDAAYAPRAFNGGGLIAGDSNGAVNNPTPAGTIVSASADGLPGGNSPRTVEFWEQTTAATGTFFGYGQQGGNNQYFQLSLQNGTLHFVAWFDDFLFNVPYPINDGTPHAIALTYDGNLTITAYIDGQQIGQRAVGASLNTALYGQALEIGNGTDSPFVGKLGEFAIFNSALSSGQIGTEADAAGTMIIGTVLGNNNAPLAGAVVEACTFSGASCGGFTYTTSSTGAFVFNVPPGSYAVTAFPPANSPFIAPVTTGPFQMPPSARNVTISFNNGLPANGTFSSPGFGSQQGGSPSVNWTEPSTYQVTGCQNGFGFLVIMAPNVSTGQQDSIVVPLIETPPGSGTYVGQIPALAPMHGSATVAQMISCPGLSPVFPAGGPPAGGTKVILNVGSAASQVTAVTFGSAPAQSFSDLGGGFMLAVSPAGSGTVPVTVNSPSNSSLAIGTFTYSSVTSLSSSAGPQDGGGTITITGSGFTDTQGVMFGAFPSPSFRIDSPTQITAVVPAGLPGLVHVVVVGLHHITDILGSPGYQYLVTAAEHAIGPLTQKLAEQVVDLYLEKLGVGLADRVALGALARIAVGEGAAGVIDSLLGRGVVAAAGSAAFSEFVEVVLIEATPYLILAGVIGAGVLLGVFIYWKLFIDPSGTVEDAAGNPLRGASATLLRQSAPSQPFTAVAAASGTMTPAVNPETTGPSGAFHWDAIAGTYQVEASANGCTAPGNLSQSTVTTPAFVIPPPAVGLVLTLACPNPTPATPVVTAVAPNLGLGGGGTQVAISGTGFGATTSVHFGTAAATQVTVLSPYALIAIAPAFSGASPVDVTVSAPGGTSATSTGDQFGYYTPPGGPNVPAVTSVSPVNGPVVGGNLVTINGGNLGAATAISFGNAPAVQVTTVSATQVKAIAPANLLPGRVDVTVYNAAGASAPSTADAYFYGSQIPSTVAVTSSANPSVFGQPVTFQATVSAGASGTVQFAVDGVNLGTPVTISGGQAAASAISTLAVGGAGHVVSVTYAGDGHFLGSQGSLTQTVNQAATSINAASSQSPTLVNSPVTLTATVAVQSPGAGVPTGAVAFSANGANLGSPVALNGGQASLTTTALAPGHYSITATYNGDPNFLGAASPSITQLIRNNLIAFTSTRDGNFELYVMHPDGTLQTRLTFNAAVDSEPVLSPDGSQVAFTSNRSGNSDIWVMKAAPESSTNVPRNLTANPAVDADPTWSPDGRTIAFASTRSGRSQLWLVNADVTGTATRLTNDLANDINPSWSPDGTRIAYASDAPKHFQLYVASLSGKTIGSALRLTTDAAADVSPAWSPDGRLIAFTSAANARTEVWVIPSGGGTAVQETSNPTSGNATPAWSPDGAQIAFTRGSASAVQINVVAFNPTGLGTGQATLTSGGANQLPNWCCAAAP